MPVSQAVAVWLQQNGWGNVTAATAVGGGCISNATRIDTSSGRTGLLKTNHSAPPRFFACEADGLAALAAANGLRVPRVFGWGDNWLLQEFIGAAPRVPDFESTLGAQLAAQHANTAPQFGFDDDNYIGATPQPNPWMADGYAFFAQQRLGFQVALARERGLLSRDEARLIERVAARLPDLVPTQPASLLHGDLWGGNVIVGPDGEPVLIDPAAHYGWAEAELAMTALFGRRDAAFYDAYASNAALTPGWQTRLDLYNLYHLLNHLNLFGGSYHGSVVAVGRRYA